MRRGRKLSDLAYSRFKERLFARDMQPGQFLSQREIVQLTGVALSPTREALQRLETEGLVRVVPQRGVQITDASLKMIRDTFHLRMVLEREAAAHFAKQAPDGRIAALLDAHRAIVVRTSGDIDDALLSAAQRVDWSMHDAMIADMDNGIIAEIHRVNSDRIRLIRMDLGLLTPTNLRRAMDEHIAVLEACAARDPTAAAQAIEQHLSTAMRRAMGV